MTAHTEGFARIAEEAGPCVVVVGARELCECYQDAEVQTAEDEANAARVVACWNACIDIPTESLSDGCVLKLGTEQELEVVKAERDRDALVQALRDIDSTATKLGASGIPTAVATALQGIGLPRFLNVSCSQCGQDFGPGDAGFSHCKDHADKVPE